MDITIGILLGIAFLCFLAEVASGIKKMIMPAESMEIEKQEIDFRYTWVDVEPAPLKIICLSFFGKATGQLVMHGPFNGEVNRLFLLFKDQKTKSYKLESKNGFSPHEIESIYEHSIAEAKRIAQAVYGKKKHLKTEQAIAPPSTKPDVSAAQVIPTAEPVKVVAPEPEVARAPIIKGFKAKYEGVFIKAGMEKHITTKDGAAEEYSTFTMTLDTSNGPIQVTGNDLKRALVVAGVKEGDLIRAIYLKNETAPNGYEKKSYQIMNLSHSGLKSKTDEKSSLIKETEHVS